MTPQASDLVERLIEAARDAEMQVHYGTTGSRRHADAELEEATASLADTIAKLNEWLAETQMLATKWMQAHDKLKAGKPYDLPKPADLPDALAKLEADNARLRQLDRYVRHQPGCTSEHPLRGDEEDCTCGLRAALNNGGNDGQAETSTDVGEGSCS